MLTYIGVIEDFTFYLARKIHLRETVLQVAENWSFVGILITFFLLYFISAYSL